MKLNNLQLVTTSIAAIGGVVIAGYQAFNSTPPQPVGTAPVQVTLTLDANGKPVQPTSAAKAPIAAQVTNSQDLLGNMRASLALVTASYAAGSGATQKHRSSALVVQSASEAALAIGDLDTAVKKKDGRKVSEATRNTSRSISKLQSTYALVPEKSERTTAALRAVNANWTAYSSRYALDAESNGRPHKVATTKRSAAETKKLKQDVARLNQRIAKLEAETRKNKALQREVARMRSEMAYYDDFDTRDYDDERYQGLLFTLSIVGGMFDAMLVTTEDYYPEYYVYFEPYRDDRDYWQSHWDGYYDAYYENDDWDRYDERFVVPQQVVLVPTQEINIYQNITVQQIVQISEKTTVELSALPAEELTTAAIEAPPADTVTSSQSLVAVSQMKTEAPPTETLQEPAAEEPAVAVEAPAPAVEEPAPQPEAAEAVPAVEEPAPAVEQPAPQPEAAEPVPAVEEPAPAVEEPVPQPETTEPAPAVEDPAPAVEEPAVVPDPNQPVQPIEEPAPASQ